MGKWQGRSERKPTGGRHNKHRKKKKREYGSPPTRTRFGEEKKIKEKVRGENKKTRLESGGKVNVSTPSEGNSKQVKIEEVLENPASADLTRRNILTKGTIVDTKLGKVKITSRPGQDGVLNGILVETKEH